ncbi:MAG: hypothetical protein AAFX41_00705 [Bacteroidota bacterium]
MTRHLPTPAYNAYHAQDQIQDAEYEMIPELDAVALATDTGANKRLPCAILADASSSMAKDIGALNAGLAALHADLCSHPIAAEVVELMVIRFGGDARVVQDFATPGSTAPPTLRAGGGTPMGRAVEMAVERVQARAKALREQGIDVLVPWVFLITDGCPTDNISRARTLVSRSAAGHNERRRALNLFAVGTETADFAMLKQLSPVNPPLHLQGCDFKALFDFVSQSLTLASGSQPGQAVQPQLPQQITIVT